MKRHPDDALPPERSLTESLDSLALTVECDADLTFKPAKPSPRHSALALALKGRTGEEFIEQCASVEADQVGPFRQRKTKPGESTTDEQAVG